jgi:hypothetical protein
MKTQTTFLMIILVSMAGVAGCAAPATLPPATQAQPTQPPTQTIKEQPASTRIPATQSPVGEATPQDQHNPEIVLNMVERLNAGDVEGSLAYFADEAMGYIVGLPPTGMEVYGGKEQIRSLWEDSVANHFIWEVKITSAYGDLVNVRAKTWHDFTRQLEVAPLEYLDVYEVKDGKIVTYYSTITEEALGRFKPAFAEVVPPEPTPAPSSDPPVSEMAVTIADGTCITRNPITLKTGEVTVTLNVEDQDHSLYALTLFNLDPGKDILDLMATTSGAGPPGWANMLLIKELGPGKGETYTFSPEKGPIYLICWSQPPGLPIGNAGPIAVVP